MFDSSNQDFNYGESVYIDKPNQSTIRKSGIHSVTTLPIIGGDVIKSPVTGGNVINWSKLALFLINKGYLPDDSNEKNPVLIAQSCLKKWADKHVSGINCCSFSLYVTPQIHDLGFYNIYDDSGTEVETSVFDTDLYFVFDHDQSGVFTIGKKIEELESLVPNLGQTVYYWLAKVSENFFDCITPWSAFHSIAPFTWWNGEMTDKGFAEASEYDDEDEGDDENLTPKPSEYKASFPKYVTSIKKPLSHKMLKELSINHSDDLIREICKVTAAMSKVGDFCMPGVNRTEYTAVYSPLYFYWEEGDNLSRVMDDYFYYASQSQDSYTEKFGLAKCPVDDQEMLSEFFTNLENGFAQLKNIERLISMIGVQI